MTVCQTLITIDIPSLCNRKMSRHDQNLSYFDFCPKEKSLKGLECKYFVFFLLMAREIFRKSDEYFLVNSMQGCIKFYCSFSFPSSMELRLASSWLAMSARAWHRERSIQSITDRFDRSRRWTCVRASSLAANVRYARCCWERSVDVRPPRRDYKIIKLSYGPRNVYLDAESQATMKFW